MHALEMLGTAGQMAGVIVIDAIASVAVFSAIVRVLTLPKEKWPHGRMSQTAWVVATIWFMWIVGHVLVPLGAVVALWRSHSVSREVQGQARDIPAVDGEAVSKENCR